MEIGSSHQVLSRAFANLKSQSGENPNSSLMTDTNQEGEDENQGGN